METNTHYKAFTLFELIIVLVIISSMVAIVVPLSGRSRENLKIDQLASDIQQAISFAINLAQTENTPVRFTANKKYRYFNITQYRDQDYVKVQGPAGTDKYYHENISIGNEDGVIYEKEKFYLIFDPAKRWPKASFSIYNNDAEYYIKIDGKNVRIEKTI